jgi:hypothetical protein
MNIKMKKLLREAPRNKMYSDFSKDEWSRLKYKILTSLRKQLDIFVEDFQRKNQMSESTAKLLGCEAVIDLSNEYRHESKLRGLSTLKK